MIICWLPFLWTGTFLIGWFHMTRKSTVVQPLPFFLIHTLSSYLSLSTMAQTRRQLENLSKDKLNDEVLSLENFKNDINSKFSELNDQFNDFEAKYEMVNSTVNCFSLLHWASTWAYCTQLECNNLSNTQFNRREILEINHCNLI